MNRDNVIQGLRELADLLEAKPEFPLPRQLEQPQPSLSRWIWSKEELFELAHKLGSFKKRYTDDKFELIVTLPSGLDLIYYCDRDKVCKKIVTYECEDAESILLEIPEPVAVTVGEEDAALL